MKKLSVRETERLMKNLQKEKKTKKIKKAENEFIYKGNRRENQDDPGNQGHSKS